MVPQVLLSFYLKMFYLRLRNAFASKPVAVEAYYSSCWNVLFFVLNLRERLTHRWSFRLGVDCDWLECITAASVIG